jgi:hypothetical protein
MPGISLGPATSLARIDTGDRSHPARSAAKTSNSGWFAAAGRYRLCATHTSMTQTKKPRAARALGFGQALSSHLGTGEAEILKPWFSVPPAFRRTPKQFVWRGLGGGSTLAGLYHQGQHQPQRRVHISSARRTLVRQDQYGPEQGEKVVLLGAGGRSRRLPSSEKLASTFSVAATQEDAPRLAGMDRIGSMLD